MRPSLLSAATFVLAGCVASASPPILPPPPPQLPAPVATNAGDDHSADDDATPPPPKKASLSELEVTAATALIAAIAARDAKKIGEVYAADAVISIIGDRTLTGRDAIVAEYQRWLDGMKDLKFELGRVFQNDSTVVAEWAFSGTHTGDFLGVKATQAPVGAAGASVLTFDADGHVTKEERIFDIGTIRKQDDKRSKVGTFRAPPPLPVNVEPHVAKSAADGEAQLAIARAFYTALDGDKVGDALALAAEDLAIEDYSRPRPIKGKAAARTLLEEYEQAMPNGTSTTNMFAADAYVVADREVHSSTKRRSSVEHFIDVLEIRDGKIARFWTWSNPAERSLPPAAVK
jgi:ketosteroid isomerase-like protein